MAIDQSRATQIDISPQPPRKKRRSRSIDRIPALIAAIGLIVAWILGGIWAGSDLEPVLEDVLPEAASFEEINSKLFTAYGDDGSLLGYVAVGTADGYGGPLEMAVGVDTDGTILGTAILDQKETGAYFRRVTESGLLDEMPGKSYQDDFVVGEDIDAVSGATYSANSVAGAVLDAAQIVASDQLGFEVASAAAPGIVFGFPEVVLIALYGFGFVGHLDRFRKYSKKIRWFTLIVGMIVLGFMLNVPLTIARLTGLAMGYWPAWQTNLYWYMLVGGILFVFTVDNKNAYCHWMCPFGAAQECLAVVGGAKHAVPRRYRRFFIWVQRGLAWLVIALAFLTRNSGVGGYDEVFGTLFGLAGSTVLFALLGLVLILSLFMKRPFCYYLCPLDPVFRFIRMGRAWVIELWKNARTAKPAV